MSAVPRKNFTMVSNNLFEDPRLKPVLFKLLAYMISKPAHWKFRTTELSNSLYLNISTIKRGLRQLVSLGYITRTRLRDKDGKLGEFVTSVIEREIINLDNKQPELNQPAVVQHPLPELKVQPSVQMSPMVTSGPKVTSPSVQMSPLDSLDSNTDLSNTYLKQAASKQGNTNTPREAVVDTVGELTTVVSLKPAAAAVFLKNAGKETNQMEIESKTVGNEQVAKQLCSLLEDQLPIDRMLAAISHYGAPKVDAAVRVVAKKMKTENISNMGAFLKAAIERDWASEKTSPERQNQPSRASYQPTGNSNSSFHQAEDFSGGVSNLSSIDEIKKQTKWPIAENRAFYYRLGRENRQAVVDAVALKWIYIHDHAKFQKVDLLSDDFPDSPLFVQFSEILNLIRFEKDTSHLRTKIWNET